MCTIGRHHNTLTIRIPLGKKRQMRCPKAPTTHSAAKTAIASCFRHCDSPLKTRRHVQSRPVNRFSLEAHLEDRSLPSIYQ